ncbi:30S ribosomal protein S13 [Candidatus Woesearchaeota archaeon]|nr:30S ribosomal protein S13 [Candidatus Woesearchaeota archaeon]
MEQKKDFQHIVRIANTDLDGRKGIGMALQKIKGVSFMYSNMVLKTAGIPPKKKAGDLSQSEVKAIDTLVRNPEGAPIWLYNRRKDPETGADIHLLTVDLKFTRDNDIRTMQKIKCYKGVRHQTGLPVRGQRTKSNFRRNKGKVQGVKRKKIGKK